MLSKIHAAPGLTGERQRLVRLDRSVVSGNGVAGSGERIRPAAIWMQSRFHIQMGERLFDHATAWAGQRARPRKEV